MHFKAPCSDELKASVGWYITGEDLWLVVKVAKAHTHPRDQLKA
jgi:hypothetical protein